MTETINKPEVIPCDNPSGIVCFDTETTGIDPYENNEILQVSFVDGEGNVLLNSLVKPENRKQWPNAQKVNGISPKMVKEAPTLAALAPQIRGILDSAKILIAYNMEFDVDFLIASDLKFDHYIHPETKVDVMLDYAEVVGKWNDYYGDYKWHKLVDCAKHYGFDWSTTGTHEHDSLGDALATLYCYPLVKRDLEAKREKQKARKKEAALKVDQRKENNIKYLNDNAQYFNKKFINDYLNYAEAGKLDLITVNHSCGYIKPIVVFIFASLAGFFALDRFYLAVMTLKSGIKGLSSKEWIFAFVKLLLMLLSSLSGIFIVLFMIMFIWDICFSINHTKKINERNLVADSDLSHSRYCTYKGSW